MATADCYPTLCYHGSVIIPFTTTEAVLRTSTRSSPDPAVSVANDSYICPPRALAWNPSIPPPPSPVSARPPSRWFQYGPSPHCAEPVAGSSGIPMLGPKKREVNAASGQRGLPPLAVTMKPRVSIPASRAWSGTRASTAAGLTSSIRRSYLF